MLLTDKITEALQRGEYPIFYPDFLKAFGKVDHAILPIKLSKCGIQGVELQWFSDYLLNRLQYVAYNRHNSQWEN